jgi:hypothetical protein
LADLTPSARPRTPIPVGRVFCLPFDGDLDAVWQTGEVVEPSGFPHFVFDAGKFVDGVRGQAFHPIAPPGHTDQRAVSYPIPPGFPTQGKGTVSMWLKLDDPQSAARLQDIKLHPWASAMRFLWSHVSGVLIEKGERRDGRELLLNVGPTFMRFDATALIKPMQWRNLTITWQPKPQSPTIGQVRVYIDGKLVQTAEGPTGMAAGHTPSSVGLYVGNSPMGGPWWGAIDELTIWNRDLPEVEVRKMATLPPAAK